MKTAPQLDEVLDVLETVLARDGCLTLDGAQSAQLIRWLRSLKLVVIQQDAIIQKWREHLRAEGNGDAKSETT